MGVITSDTRLDSVEHILVSGSGILDFAVSGRDDYVTWRGTEDANWTFEDVASVENVEEDRLIVYPEGEHFICEVPADGEEGNRGPVKCRSE